MQELPEYTQHPGFHEVLLEWIVRLPGIGPATPILDLGCGSGAWLARLARIGFENLHGVDNESFVRFPALGQLPVSFVHADLDNDSNLGLGTTKFGLITAIEVIEHVHNPGRLLRFAARHLHANGLFLITTPNVHSVRARVRFALTGKLAAFDPTNVSAEPTHLYPVFITCLDKLLAHYGMETVERWTFPEDRGNGSRWVARFVAAILGAILANQYPGDTLCVLARPKP